MSSTPNENTEPQEEKRKKKKERNIFGIIFYSEAGKVQSLNRL